MSDLEWKEYDHPTWGKGGKEEGVHLIVSPTDFPRKIWRKGKLSIIPPCGITFGMWELYDGSDTHRFKTLDEAKNYKHD